MVSLAFTKHQVVPDGLSYPPTQLLKVKYPKSGKIVNLGNELAPVDVRDKPDVTYDADTDTYYTLIFTDIDVPNRENPVGRGVMHWLVGNIPGADVSKGQHLTGYVGSGPPEGSGLHRYVFLLYKQPKKIDFEEKVIADNELSGRTSFSPEIFSNKYNLELKAGNFYEAQYDESVLALYKYLGFVPPPKVV